jgi:hypothetical protein
VSTTVEIKREDLKSKDAKTFFAKLNVEYPGKWIAILQNGDLIAKDTLAEIYSSSDEKASKIMVLFRESKKGQLLFK